MKFVVSFTTSPERISKIKPMIDSILKQRMAPDLFLLNIPEVFPRTNKKYIIPDFVRKSATINIIKRDYGPATKLVPTIKHLHENNYSLKETYIIYLDDDIEYRPDMISAYNFILQLKSKPMVICAGGFDFVIHDNKIRLSGKRKHNDSVSVAEGYASVCLPLSIIEKDFFGYIEKYTFNSDYKHCKLSDDVLFSNYYAMKNVDIKIISLPGKFSMIDLWKNNCILDYGNLKDALHCGASGTSEGNIQRYPNVLSTLQKNGELYLKVYLSNNHNNLQFY